MLNIENGLSQFMEVHFWITTKIAVFGLPANQNPDPEIHSHLLVLPYYHFRVIKINLQI